MAEKKAIVKGWGIWPSSAFFCLLDIFLFAPIEEEETKHAHRVRAHAYHVSLHLSSVSVVFETWDTLGQPRKCSLLET